MNAFAIRSSGLRRWMAGAVMALTAAAAGAAPTNTFTVNVPHRTGGSQFELSALKVTVQLDSSAAIALQLNEASSGTLATNSMDLTSATVDCFAGPSCFSDFPNLPGGAAQKDRLTVIKPKQAGADPGSAGNDKLVLILRLRSNINETGGCVSTMSADETWTVSVVGGAARITAVSVQSLDKKTTGAGNPVCGTSYRPVPLNDGPLATVAGQPALLAGGRVGVDAVMVLDRSGSMSDPASSMGGAPSKMTRLGLAAETFIDMWGALRANECQNFAVSCPASGGLPGIQGPVDHLGVVFFDDAFSWLKTLRPASAIDGIKDFSTLDLVNEKTQIKAVGPNGATSIGGGLKLAAPALAPSISEPNRKVILLMTDGMQNTDPLVQVAGSQVQTTIGGTVTNLANQPPIQIYGVTVGTGVAVDATVNQAVATASNGFYLNTEDDDAILPNLFVQVLQNAVKYSSVDTLRVIADKTRFNAAFSTTVPVTSTTFSLAFNLTWNPNQGRMSVRLLPPEGGAPLVFALPPDSNTGLLTGRVAFPAPGIPVSSGDWTLQIALSGSDSTTGVPFNFTLLADDVGVNAALGPVKAEYAVGGQLTLTAQVNDLDGAIGGIGGQPNAQVQVFVVRPGVSVGDVLSDTAAAPAPPGPNDSASAAELKLKAILAANPNALLKASDVVSLVEEPGGGRYRATINTDFEGHYNLVFIVEGTSASGGRFVRQAIRTVHVRSLPDANNTQVTTNTVQLTTGSVLNVSLVPKNVRGGKMGPGWTNYFWLQPAGGPPVKLVDNLDGSYSGQVPFTGAAPTVSVHFLPEPVVRPDSFVPATGQLNGSNEVIHDVMNPPGGGTGAGRAVWIALGSTFPHGSFSSAYKGGFAGNIGYEYPLGPRTSIEATLGYHQFKGKSGAPDIDVTQYGVNGKWYLAAPFNPFVTVGIGGYSFNPGSSRFGGSVGVGAQAPIAPHWSVEGRYAYHMVSGNSPNSHYSTLQIGVRYGF
jgi:hypothetical protein